VTEYESVYAVRPEHTSYRRPVLLKLTQLLHKVIGRREIS